MKRCKEEETSPGRLLERLAELRQLQTAQASSLMRQRLDCRTGPGVELQLSADSPSYRKFRHQLRDSPAGSEADVSPTLRLSAGDLPDGVSVLNLSRESECQLGSPLSARTTVSGQSDAPSALSLPYTNKSEMRNYIELDEMPILSPRTDFETLLLEKIKNEKSTGDHTVKNTCMPKVARKPFLKRGEGLNRFGIKKDELIIQNTKSLPWRKKMFNRSHKILSTSQNSLEYAPVGKSVKEINEMSQIKPDKCNKNDINDKYSRAQHLQPTEKKLKTITIMEPECQQKTRAPKKQKTWAAVLTQEQDIFLKQLKQSSYYKNFASPAKSVVSDTSCDGSLHTLHAERETAEQNLFELLENKVSHQSFCSESSFLTKFINKKSIDFSGDSTPLNIQKCLANNPQLLQLFPLPHPSNKTEKTVEESTEREYVDCDHETCSSTSTSCTCETVEETNNSVQTSTPQVKETPGRNNDCKGKSKKLQNKKECDETVTESEVMKANMAEMNAKLSATSELLRDRLHELEDEIDMFRKENSNLNKMREELEVEKQRFFDERSAYEQKFNEDKVLSEYYLIEEKEKLAKQKQVYDRYIREMRGRLNKKEKDDVTQLKKEIEDLKEEMRTKDSKLTSCIARLRNQLKLLEKEKKDLLDECEKLKTANKRIQQVNTTTRRLSNIKYLAEINRKLTMISVNDKSTEVYTDHDAKFKSHEIANRDRVIKKIPVNKLRTRAKSVPNLTVTSRYAKYFSQRDAISQMDHDTAAGGDYEDIVSVKSDHSSDVDYKMLRDYETELSSSSRSADRQPQGNKCNEENHLEKMYLHTFSNDTESPNERASSRFPSRLKSFTTLDEGPKSPDSSYHRSKSPSSAYNLPSSGSSQTLSGIISPIPPLNLSRSTSNHTFNHSKSPVSILSNRSSTGSHKSHVDDNIITHPLNDSPPSSRKPANEDSISRTSLTRTNLNPTEIKRPDGTRELRFPNGNIKIISADGKSSKFIYYNGDVKETFYDEGKIKYFYAETKTYHTTHVDGLEVLQFPDGQVEKRYKDGSIEIRLPNDSVRYSDPKNEHVSEEWRFPDGTVLTVACSGEQVVRFPNGQIEVHAKDHKRREFPDGTVKLVYSDGTSETRYSSGRVRIKNRHGALIMDSAQSAS